MPGRNDRHSLTLDQVGAPWLLDVIGCPNLSFATTIGLTSNMHEVTVMLDKVITGQHDVPCSITRVRSLDLSHLKATRNARRNVEERSREAPAAT